MSRPRDPEKVSYARELANYGTFEVAVIHDEHGELGTLDKTFSNDADASWAANDARVPDIGIETEIRELDD